MDSSKYREWEYHANAKKTHVLILLSQNDYGPHVYVWGSYVGRALGTLTNTHYRISIMTYDDR